MKYSEKSKKAAPGTGGSSRYTGLRRTRFPTTTALGGWLGTFDVYLGAVMKSSANSGRRRIEREPYSWLRASALAVGLGAAMAGGHGVAAADDSTSGVSPGPGEPSSTSAGSAADGSTNSAFNSTLRAGTHRPGFRPANPKATADVDAADTPAVSRRQKAARTVVTSSPAESLAGIPQRNPGGDGARREEGEVLDPSVSSLATSDAGWRSGLTATQLARATSVPEAEVTVAVAPATPVVPPVLAAAPTTTFTPSAPLRTVGALAWGALRDLQAGLVGAARGVVVGAAKVTAAPAAAAGPLPVANGWSVAGASDPTTGRISGAVSFLAPAGTTLSYTAAASSTGGGKVSISKATGAFVYTPTAAQRRAATAGTTDTFTVRATNGVDTVEQLVTVAVDVGTPVPGAPTTGTPNSITGVVSGRARFTDPAGRPMTFGASQTSTGGGAVSVNTSSGTYTYTPTQTQRQQATATSTDTFTITASNGVNTATSTITVAIGAGTPQTRGVALSTANTTTGAVSSISAGFTDPAGRPLTYSGPTTSTGGGTVSVDPTTGAFTYTPTQTQRQTATLTTRDTITVTASNGVNSTTRTISVPIDPGTPVAGPTIKNPADTNTGAVTGTAIVTDTAGRTLTYTAPATSTRGGTVSIDTTTGAFIYTPTTTQRRTATNTTTDTFTITATNGIRTITQKFTVAVDPGTPVAALPTVGVPDSVSGVVTGSAVFTDSTGRKLAYSSPSTSTGGGTVSINATTGAFIYTPTAAQQRNATDTTTDTFTVTASNGVRTTSQSVTVTVDPRTTFGTVQQAMVTSTGQIWGFINGGQTSYTLAQAPQFGVVSITDRGVYTYKPSANFTGLDSFTVSLPNAEPGKQSTEVTVTVVGDPVETAVTHDFSGAADTAPDPAMWVYATGWDAGLQTYTDSLENIHLDGQGNLVIQALKTDTGYSSGRLTTQGTVDMLYGTMTARVKLPAGQGIWPAIWQLGSTYSQATWDAPGPTGWPGAGEIDLIELVNNGTTYYTTLHGPQGTTDYYAGSGEVVGTSGPIDDLTTDFHDYWVMRQANIIVIGVDDTMLATFTPESLPSDATWAFNRPMFAIFNVAVGFWAGQPDETTPWPATMLVDSFTYTPYG